MRRIILLFLSVMLLSFTACQKEEDLPKYDLTLCDKSFSDVYKHLNQSATETNRIESKDFSIDNPLDYISTHLGEYLLSITIYSENITDEWAINIINSASELNIPVLFIGQLIDNNILLAYDKAFCITTNYTHAGEVMAAKILQLWQENLIIDRDQNKIFAFSAIRYDVSPNYISEFSESLIRNIEIYGIPIQINEDIVVNSPEEMPQFIDAAKAHNESFFILFEDLLNISVEQYTPVGEGVEIISLARGITKPHAEIAKSIICFVNYNEYIQAATEIMSNYQNRQYPLSDISYPVNDRIVYIPIVI